jgi:NAD(P)H-hydrate repair Nnr-like enzyme with NAD(P)H-hydrate dehydratase domain
VTSKQPHTVVSAETVAKLLPVRGPGAHKWGVGGLVIVAGSQTYIGAAALASMSAGRAGAGIVTVAMPRRAIGVVATLVPEAVFIPLRDGEPGPAARAAIEAIKPKLDRSKALLIGPGLGDDDHAEALLAAIFGIGAVARPATVGFHRRDVAPESSDSSESLLSPERPAVVDADALNWLATRSDWYERVPASSLVLTPHAGGDGPVARPLR